MDTKYSTNPAVQFEWTDSEQTDPPLVASVASHGTVAVHDVQLLDALEYAFDPRSRAELRAHMAEECGYDRSEARKRLDELLDDGLLLPAEQVEERRNWYEHGWNLSLYYHLATRDWSFDGHAEAPAEAGAAAEPAVGDEVALPSPDPIPDEPIDDVLLDRRTCRDFDGSAIESADLSSILYHGLAPARDAGDGQPVSKALSYFDADTFPFAVYPVVARSGDLGRGLYRYRVDDHSLASLEDWAGESPETVDDRLQNIVTDQPFIQGGSATLLFTADFEAAQRRYADAAALRHVYASVSTHAHRVLLAANAFGFDAFQSAALKDSTADELVGVDGYRRTVLYFMTIGREDE